MDVAAEAVLPPIPRSDGASQASRSFAVYVHVPFCASRCGYCDFNTYTAAELGDAPGASRTSWHEAAMTEIRLAAGRLAAAGAEVPHVETVFFGGGTPTLLAPEALVSVLSAIRQEFGLVSDAEVTVEANPDSVTPASLGTLRDGGFTRVSFGMQSAVPHVLEVLDRTHTPGRSVAAVGEARAAGFEHVSLDLIYGTPTESLQDWETSLDAALATDVDHVSAYSLILEPGTRLARQVDRGEYDRPDDDLVADMYEVADARMAEAGFDWYELSNFASRDSGRCRHNEIYWTGGNWWGVGPGAHSHVNGMRWWNAKHPAAWAQRLSGDDVPAAGYEVLDQNLRHIEDVMLRTRLAEGLPLALLGESGGSKATAVVEQGLGLVRQDRLVLTLRGRLLADAVIRDLLD